ncbi:hypothetical protein SH584_11685 [Sphingomonas sp. LY29]|uniref:hypothetical protein n=1 Tax=Sphingomonas sp. LY29 TaxID=3095341 RepID=UPI002D79951F|nr:hypothetical protein [Sphingomonas sp. LY29]WRP25692.1 hypothetical protein SH584_11685 [Sphingomonas sp. LY29]
MLMPPPSPYSLARSRWLSDLADALDEARRLAAGLGGDAETHSMKDRIDAVIDELEQLRRGRVERSILEEALGVAIGPFPDLPG